MTNNFVIGLVLSGAINGALILPASKLPLLTRSGWWHAWGLGTLLGASLGWRGWLLVVVYLGLGSAVTKLGFAHKQAMGIAEARDGKRGPENVWGSAATGLVLALATLAPGAPKQWLMIGFVASFAAKLADTFATEIGKRWGRTTISLSRWRPVAPGSDGAVSLEGTAASLGGALLFSCVAWALQLIQASQIPLIAAVGLIASLLESLIGAEIQPRFNWLTNEMVNGLLTVIAAGLAMALMH
jgi:uncharacterized protein (TIGR00297 family)